MPAIIVLGAGVCGLASAMLLARDGHDVTVLERDPEPVPDSLEEAWARWPRSGVAQFRQAHFMQARAREVLDAALPDVRDALLEAGALRFDPLAGLPPGIADREPRPGDERMRTITARRTTLEYVVARAAEAEPRVEVRRGTGVERLLARSPNGVPAHVTGVRTEAGEELGANLVVDAMGRRSKLPAWLREAGAGAVAEEAEDSGFIYYTRFFRGPSAPAPRAPLLSPLGTFSVLTVPGDSGTWSVTVYVSAGDRALKGLRHPDRFEALVRACPLHAHWLDGEPLGPMEAMGGVLDRHRRLVGEDGRPVATGIAPVGDAWACTNPSLGRGIALGLVQASLLREVAREHLGEDPARLAAAFDAATEEQLTPWYRATIAVDRARLAEIEALRRGEAPPPPAGAPAMVGAALPVAMGLDADVFRAGMEITGCLTLPRDVFARPGLAERVLELARDRDGRLPAPSREQAVALAS